MHFIRLKMQRNNMQSFKNKIRLTNRRFGNNWQTWNIYNS